LIYPGNRKEEDAEQLRRTRGGLKRNSHDKPHPIGSGKWGLQRVSEYKKGKSTQKRDAVERKQGHYPHVTKKTHHAHQIKEKKKKKTKKKKN